MSNMRRRRAARCCAASAACTAACRPTRRRSRLRPAMSVSLPDRDASRPAHRPPRDDDRQPLNAAATHDDCPPAPGGKTLCVTSEPSEYLAEHVVDALARDPRLNELGLHVTISGG